MLREQKLSAARRRRRPPLLLLVFGVFLVLVGVTATALVAITTSHLTQVTVNASVERDASLVALFVNSNLRTADLRDGGPGSERSAELSAKLAVLRTMRNAVASHGWTLLSDDEEDAGEHDLPA